MHKLLAVFGYVFFLLQHGICEDASVEDTISEGLLESMAYCIERKSIENEKLDERLRQTTFPSNDEFMDSIAEFINAIIREFENECVKDNKDLEYNREEVADRNDRFEKMDDDDDRDDNDQHNIMINNGDFREASRNIYNSSNRISRQIIIMTDETSKKTNRQSGMKTTKHSNKKTNKHSSGKTNKHSNKKTNKQTNKKITRQKGTPGKRKKNTRAMMKSLMYSMFLRSKFDTFLTGIGPILQINLVVLIFLTLLVNFGRLYMALRRRVLGQGRHDHVPIEKHDNSGWLGGLLSWFSKQDRADPQELAYRAHVPNSTRQKN